MTTHFYIDHSIQRYIFWSKILIYIFIGDYLDSELCWHKDETCLQFKMKRHHIKTWKISQYIHKCLKKQPRTNKWDFCFSSNQTKYDNIFRLYWNQMEFKFVPQRKKEYYNNHICSYLTKKNLIFCFTCFNSKSVKLIYRRFQLSNFK